MSESKLIGRAIGLLEGVKGQKLDVTERRDKAIELAAWLVTESRNRLTSRERNMQSQLAGMMQDGQGKAFTTAMTDQCFRSQRSTRVADQMVHLLRKYGIPKFLPFESRWRLWLFRATGPWIPGLLIPLARRMLRREMRQVIVPGENDRLKKHMRRRAKDGVRVNLNHIGEAILGEEEADRRLQIYLDSLADPTIEYVSVKISTICSQINLLSWDETLSILRGRLRKLYQAAAGNHFVRADGSRACKFVNLDMEEYRDLHLTVALFCNVLDEPEFSDHSAGIVLQAYLPDSYLIQQELTVWAMKRVAHGGAPIKIRLVKGANLAMERVESSIADWPQAPYPDKVDVDANYKRMLDYASIPEHAAAARIGIGSHNLFDIAYALLIRSERRVEPYIGFEMLEGMADHMRRVVQEVADDILLYCPAAKEAEFVSAVSYLIRRLDENTSEDNFLRHSFSLEPGSPEWDQQVGIFAQSCERIAGLSQVSRRRQNRFQIEQADREADFENDPHTDWALEKNIQWAREIVSKFPEYEEIPIVVAGEEILHAKEEGFDPSRPEAIPYRFSLATEKDVSSAVEASVVAREQWMKVSVSDRSAMAARVAQELREQRKALIRTMVCDGGKTVPEADAELNEAIDFAEYYRRSLEEWDELDGISWTPKGTVLVASPWNFPLAIPLGGVLSALLAGNTVIFKPAQETVLAAWRVANVLWDAGVPRDVLQFVVCEDEPVGSQLIRDKRVSAVILTGATATAQLFLHLRPGLDLMAETGGKNAMIVTGLSDRDQVVKDLVYSAFGHAGQKCSAASLAIIESEVYDNRRFRNQLRDAANSWAVGGAWDLKTKVNPLIREPNSILKRGLTQLDEGEEWLLKPVEIEKNLWTPGIKLGVKPGSFSFENELFGPVLSLVRADNIEHAIKIANGTRYGLTTGLQSLDAREQKIWIEKIEAGNCYLNRGITGAIVQRQPFGGTKDSAFGRGFKAGGPNYLLQLMHPIEKELPLDQSTPPISNFLERLQEMGIDASSDSRLGACLGSYAYWWESYFSKRHDDSKLIGQDNFLSFLPRKNVHVRVQPGDSVEDIICIIGAAQTCGAMLEISASPDDLARIPKVVELQGLQGLKIVAEEEEAFLSDCKAKSVRFLFPPSEDVARALSDSGTQVSVVPLMSHGRLELCNFVRECSLSIDYHRYGNLGDRESEERHPLHEA